MVNFSIDKIQLVEENSNSQFATIECDLCRSGFNTHRMPISKDAIKYSANSIKGKPILVSMRWDKRDFQGHDADELPCGFFEDIEPTVHEKEDGELYITAKGRIWKKYFSDVMQVFKRKNGKTETSMEIEVLEGEEPTNERDGSIDLFSFTGLTLLGVAPAIKGSEARVLSFSEIKNEYDKEQTTFNQLKEFSERRKQELADEKIYKVNESREAMSTAEWDGDKAKHDAIKAKNFESIAPKIFMRLEEGWKDKEVTKLGYPVMTLEGDTWVYSEKGLASALGYAKKEGDTEIVNKVEKIRDKLGIEDSEKEKGDGEKMENEKKEFSELEGRELYAEVIKRVHDKLGDHMYVEGIYNNKIVVRNERTKELYDIPANIKLGKDDEDMKIDIDYDKMKKSSDQKAFAKKKMDDEEDEKVKEDVDKDKQDDGEEKDDEDSEVDDDEEKEDEEKMNKKKAKKSSKKMSLDSNVDMAAWYQMLENETTKYKELARKVLEEEDRGLVMKEVLEMAKKCEELECYRNEKMEDEKKSELAKVMAEVKEDLSDEEFECLKNEGMECAKEEMTAFANKARAMAYMKSKEKIEAEDKKDEDKDKEDKKFSRMGFDFSPYLNKQSGVNISATDIFNEYK